VILAFGRPDASRPVQPSDAFATLSGTFVLSDGTLRSENLAMDARDVDLRGSGTLQVSGGAIDVKADLVLSDELSAQAGRDLYRYARQGSEIVLPGTITGTLASPVVFVDIRSALQRAAKNAIEDRLKKALDRILKR
jgi:hypothetical protein